MYGNKKIHNILLITLCLFIVNSLFFVNKLYADDLKTEQNKILDIKTITTGNDFALILKNNGDLYSLGKNDCGQLGNGNNNYIKKPIKIMDGVKDIACGFNHSLIITNDNSLYAFGDNSFYQLGLNDIKQRNMPTKVMDDVVSCSAGASFSLALKSDGTLYGFGNNLYNQLAFSAIAEYKKPTYLMSEVSSVDSGFMTSLIKKTDGKTYVMGKHYKDRVNNSANLTELNYLISDSTINYNDDIYFVDLKNDLYCMDILEDSQSFEFSQPNLLSINMKLYKSNPLKKLYFDFDKEISFDKLHNKIRSLVSKDFNWEIAKIDLNYINTITFDADKKVELLNTLKKETLEYRYNKDSKLIAITFDDGPSVYTADLINDLNKYKARCTFFVLGSNARKYTDKIVKINNDGHELANHSKNHARLTAHNDAGVLDQIDSCDNAVFELTNKKCDLFRPPYGAHNERIRSLLALRNKSVIMWNVDTLDWKNRDANYVKNYVLNNSKDGDIVLLHDIHRTTVDGFRQALPELINKGFKLVTVSELMDLRGINKIPGQVYNNAKNK